MHDGNTNPSCPHPHALLRPYPAPGLFITATGTDVGKTTVTAALAAALHRLHFRVGLCKPIASGCPKDPNRANDPDVSLTDDDLLAPDSAIAARAAGLDPADPSLLPNLAPVRFAAPISPHLAAQIEQRAPDWRRVAAALDFWQENSDLLLVEGAGGWLVPLDEHDFMIADLAALLRLPVLVVTTAELGSINQTLLTIHSIRQRNLAVAGLVINRFPAKPTIIENFNLDELPRLCGVPLRATFSDLGQSPLPSPLPESLITAILPFATEWSAPLRRDPST
jgi:dethiobiotin synthetase